MAKKRTTKHKRQLAEDPADQVTVLSMRSEPDAIAQTMTVDRVHAVIRDAEAGNTRDLFALYRDVIATDGHLQAEFSKRKLAVLGDRMAVLPWDKKTPADVKAAEAIESMIHSCQSWKKACIHLLDAVLWPVAVVEKVFVPSGRGFALGNLVPVPHHLLDYSKGEMRIHDVDPISGTILPTSREVDPLRYIVHRGHLLTMPDNWGGPMRAILFWWLLSNMSREWWARFLDRYGAPFIVAKHARGDDTSRNVLRRALSLSIKLGGLVVTEDCNVELIQASTGNTGEAYEKFLTICQREKSKIVVGQTLSSEAQSTGLGSGVADAHESVRNDIRAWDASSLGDTIRLQLAAQFLDINGITAATPTLNWGSLSPDELKAQAELLVAYKQAGLRPTDEAIEAISTDSGIALERDPDAAREVGASRPFLGSYTAQRR